MKEKARGEGMKEKAGGGEGRIFLNAHIKDSTGMHKILNSRMIR